MPATQPITCDYTSQSGQPVSFSKIANGMKYEWDFEEYTLNLISDLMDFEILSNFAGRLINSQKQLDTDIIQIVKKNFFSMLEK